MTKTNYDTPYEWIHGFMNGLSFASLSHHGLTFFCLFVCFCSFHVSYSSCLPRTYTPGSEQPRVQIVPVLKLCLSAFIVSSC